MQSKKYLQNNAHNFLIEVNLWLRTNQIVLEQNAFIAKMRIAGDFLSAQVTEVAVAHRASHFVAAV